MYNIGNVSEGNDRVASTKLLCQASNYAGTSILYYAKPPHFFPTDTPHRVTYLGLN